MAENTKERIRISITLTRYETDEEQGEHAEEYETGSIVDADESDMLLQYDTLDEEKALDLFEALRHTICDKTGFGNGRPTNSKV